MCKVGVVDVLACASRRIGGSVTLTSPFSLSGLAVCWPSESAVGRVVLEDGSCGMAGVVAD